MKNLRITFGYFGPSKYNRITWYICTKLPFIPSIEIDLFKTYLNSDQYTTIKHKICIGIFKYMFELRNVKGKWKFDIIN